MQTLGHLMVATFELVEAEGRMLRRHLIRLSAAAALAIFAFLLSVVGIAFVMFGLFRALANAMNVPLAAIIFGVVALGLAGGALWSIRKIIK